MRIVMDCRLLGAPRAGSAYYTLGLLHGLAAQDAASQYVLLCQRPLDDLPSDPRFEPRFLPEAALCDPRWEQLQLPAEVRALKPDLYFAPTSVLPMLRCCPQVTVVYDLGFVHHPEFYAPALRGYLRPWVTASAQNAAAVVCLSQYVRADVAATWGLAADKLYVVPGAPHPRFRPPEDTQAAAAVCQRHGVRKPYVLSVASLEANKNLPRLLAAFAQANALNDEAWQLVLTGRPGGATAEIQAAVARHGLANCTVLTGFVPDTDLPALYSAADLFAFVSLYEGFGLPPLEAMACGAPVLASKATSLPEVLGDAALLVDPYDGDGIAQGLSRLMSGASLRHTLAERGRVQASRYSWEQSVQALLEVLDTVAQPGSPVTMEEAVTA